MDKMSLERYTIVLAHVSQSFYVETRTTYAAYSRAHCLDQCSIQLEIGR